MAKKRGDGRERRSPAGIARERETCADDAGLCNMSAALPLSSRVE